MLGKPCLSATPRLDYYYFNKGSWKEGGERRDNGEWRREEGKERRENGEGRREEDRERREEGEGRRENGEEWRREERKERGENGEGRREEGGGRMEKGGERREERGGRRVERGGRRPILVHLGPASCRALSSKSYPHHQHSLFVQHYAGYDAWPQTCPAWQTRPDPSGNGPTVTARSCMAFADVWKGQGSQRPEICTEDYYPPKRAIVQTACMGRQATQSESIGIRST